MRSEIEGTAAKVWFHARATNLREYNRRELISFQSIQRAASQVNTGVVEGLKMTRKVVNLIQTSVGRRPYIDYDRAAVATRPSCPFNLD